MADCMTFPDTLDEFLEQYQFKDSEEIYTNGAMLIPVFRVKQWDEHAKSVFTNADRIRAMSDEDLAKFFDSTCTENMGSVRCDIGLGCYGCWLDWLQSPVEVEE